MNDSDKFIRKPPQKSTSLQNLAVVSNNNEGGSSIRKSNSSLRNREHFAHQKQSSCSMLRSYSSLSLLMREPQYELVGCRVVRGPNWKWGRQDGSFRGKLA